jgi:hypothetical protein
MLILKYVKQYTFTSKYVAFSPFLAILHIFNLCITDKRLQCKMLVLRNVLRVGEKQITVLKVKKIWCRTIHIQATFYLTDIHSDAHFDVEQLGEVLSTGGQIHARAVDKGRPSVLQVTPFSYYAIRFRPKNVRWSQIRWARNWNIGDEGKLKWPLCQCLK